MKKLLLILLSLALFPSVAHMADMEPDEGTITINITDENNAKYSGNWFLHQGVTNKGMVLRNGTGGETFVVPAGPYFLQVFKKDNIHPYFILKSDNPQALEAGTVMTFNIQYFKTEEQMNAVLNPPMVITAQPEQEDTIQTSEESEPVVVDETEETTVTDTDPKHSRTYLGPRIINAHNPALDNNAQTSSSDAEIIDVPSLAQTGSPVLFILIFSGIGGAILTRKKNK